MTHEQISQLDAIKEGRQVSVAFAQSGGTVATVTGRWVPRNPVAAAQVRTILGPRSLALLEAGWAGGQKA